MSEVLACSPQIRRRHQRSDPSRSRRSPQDRYRRRWVQILLIGHLALLLVLAYPGYQFYRSWIQPDRPPDAIDRLLENPALWARIRLRFGPFWTPWTRRTVEPSGPWAYTKPVVVLIDGHVFSSNDFFVGGLVRSGRWSICGRGADREPFASESASC